MSTTYDPSIDEQPRPEPFQGLLPAALGYMKKNFDPAAALSAPSAPTWDPKVVENINTGNYNPQDTSYRVPQVKNPSEILPPIPSVKPSATGRDYLSEVSAKDRMFNAERDTPVQTAFQAGYTPPMIATRTNPWEQKPAATADPGLLYGELVKRGQSRGDMTVANEYEKTLLAQVHAMLPGASPKEVRSVMTTINQAVRNPNFMNPTQPATPTPEPGSLAGAVAKSQQPAPNYQKLGAGQSIYQMQPDGTAKLITTAPGGAAEQHKGDQFKNAQTNSMHEWDRIKKEYDKSWDKITENVADGPAREAALRSLNANHFQSLGIPEELANVPVSFKSYLHDITNGQKISREQNDIYAKAHMSRVMARNRILEQRFGNTLNFK